MNEKINTWMIDRQQGQGEKGGKKPDLQLRSEIVPTPVIFHILLGHSPCGVCCQCHTIVWKTLTCPAVLISARHVHNMKYWIFS